MTVVKLIDETISKDIRARLNLAIDANDEIPKNHGRTAAVAALLEEGHQTVRLWLADSKTKKAGLPNVTRIPSIAEKLGININWLLAGAGPMLHKDEEDKDIVNAEALSETWQVSHKELLDIDIDNLDPQIRGIVLLHIYELIAAHNYKSETGISNESAKVFKFGLNGAKKLVDTYNKKQL